MRIFFAAQDNDAESFFSSSLSFLSSLWPGWCQSWEGGEERGRREACKGHCFKVSFPLCLRPVKLKCRCDEGRMKKEKSTNSQNASRDQKQLISGPDAKVSLQRWNEHVNLFRSKLLDSKGQRDLRVVTASISSTVEAQTAKKKSHSKLGLRWVRRHHDWVNVCHPFLRREAVLHSSVFPDCGFFFGTLCLCRSLAFPSWKPALDQDSMSTWLSPPSLSEFSTLGAAEAKVLVYFI